MFTREINSETLIKELNLYLDSSSISLSQVAKNLNISKGHLSEIKNRKTDPALNTGLRILKLCGLNLEERKAWAHLYNQKISEEYLELHSSVDRVFEKNLSEASSLLLANDLSLLNAYTDIINTEDSGLGLDFLLREYGRTIEAKLDYFATTGAVDKIESENEKAYKTGHVTPNLSRGASLTLMRNMIRKIHNHHLSDEYTNSSKLFYNDISDDGYQQLNHLIDETIQKATLIMRNNKQHRKDGGNRYFFQYMLGKVD